MKCYKPCHSLPDRGANIKLADTLQDNIKGIIGATYLIKDEYSLRKLAKDMDELNAKAKEIMPKKDGVPMGEEPWYCFWKRANGVQESSQKPTITVPLSPK